MPVVIDRKEHIVFMHKDKIKQSSRIIELIIKHHHHNLTPLEEKELKKWINKDPSNEQLFKELTDEAYQHVVLNQMDRYDEEQALAKIMRQAKFSPYATADQTPGPHWRRMAVAAAIAVLLAGVLFTLLFTSPQPEVTKEKVARNENDISPGGNKAILTLGNGSTIILDSLQTGQMTHLGNSRLTKVDSGLLVYRPSTDNKQKIQYNTLTTPRGGQFQLVLPDGTKVWLNAASSIRFPNVFAGKARVVEVTGEAYFEVAPVADMPFKVKTGHTEINVLGTHFNVSAYKDEAAIKVTLLEGAVKVSQLAAHHSQLVHPGEQVQVDQSGAIKLIKNADISRAIAWKEGRFEFHGNIREIMKKIARWYDVEVTYEGNVTEEAFGGVISKYKKVSKVLKMLELTGSIHFSIEQGDASGEYQGKIIVKP